MATMEIYSSLLCISCIFVYSMSVSGTLLDAGLKYKNASMGNQTSGVVSRNREEVWLYKYSWLNTTQVS